MDDRRVQASANFVVDDTSLAQQAQQLLEPFRIAQANKREVWNAYRENPGGVERCAARASSKGRQSGTTGAGLLVGMIREGEHLIEPDTTARPVTGWRFVRGSHSGTYVQDPHGTDPLPPGYDFTPAPRYDSPSDDDDLSLEAEIERALDDVSELL